MTGFGAISIGQLRAVMASPLGVDVYVGDQRRRGLLAKEERQVDDGSGFAVSAFVTELTVVAVDCPGIKVDSRLSIGPQRAEWAPLPSRDECTEYVVHRVGRPDDVGAQTLVLAEANR